MLKRGVDEIDLTNAVVGLTVNSSAATVSNGVADLGNVVKSNASGTLLGLLVPQQVIRLLLTNRN